MPWSPPAPAVGPALTLWLRRGPSHPPKLHFAIVLVACWLASLKQMLSGIDQVPVSLQGSALAAWALGGGLAFASCYLALPLWEAMVRWQPALQRPQPSSWVAMLLTFGLVAWVGGLVRSLVVAWWLPSLLSPAALAAFALNVGWMIAFLCLALGLIRAFSSRLQEATQARQALAEQLTASQKALVAEDERLRAELAHLLHGQVQSHLVAAWAKASQARKAGQAPGEALAHWKEAAGFLEVVQEAAVGRVQALLHPNPGQVLELLQALVQRFESFVPIRFEVAPVWQFQPPRLPQRVALLLVRMVDEALLKAFRAPTDNPLILRVLQAQDGALVVEVQADGPALGTETSTRGLGLATLGMEFLAQGGHWSLGVGADQNSCLRLSVPVALVQETGAS